MNLFYHLIEPTMTFLYSLTIIGVMYYLVNRWSNKKIKELDKKYPKTGQVISMNKMSQEEIEHLLSLDEFEQRISGN